jgi:hypothetical protein
MAYSSFKFSTGKKLTDQAETYCEYKPYFSIHDHTECVSAFQVADIVLLDYGCPSPGDIVRYDPTKDAYVLAYADLVASYIDPESQIEALGVVEEVHFDCSDNDVLGSEKIGKVVFYGRIQFREDVLTPGGVYYVLGENQWYNAADKSSGSNPILWNESTGRGFRNGTTQEPNISKPVYIATGKNIAIITNYRALVGGERDEVIPEGFELEVNCASSGQGFVVSATNNGTTYWRGPLKFELLYDKLDGMSPATVHSVIEISEEELQGLGPGKTWGPLSVGGLGSDSVVTPGKLTFNVVRGNQHIATQSSTCVPDLLVTSSCGSNGVIYEISLLNNVHMTEEIAYSITPADGSTGEATGTFVLPQGENDSVQITPIAENQTGQIPANGPLNLAFAVPLNHWSRLLDPVQAQCDQPCCHGDDWCKLGPNPTTGGSNSNLLPDGTFYYEDGYVCDADPSAMAISYEYLRENVQFCWPIVQSDEGLMVEFYIYSDNDAASKESTENPLGDEGETENRLAFIVADKGLAGEMCYITLDTNSTQPQCYQFTYNLAKVHYNIADMDPAG